MIYTSRYSNPELKTGNYTVVGITRGAPKFPLRYTLAGNIETCREYNKKCHNGHIGVGIFALAVIVTKKRIIFLI